ncbi:23S rRNA (adenine(2503)-C(2))-methyltransferase RlmN [Patescibacteria group bacterium]|nr:MAG: 23S rRNA (adenine(2503)-C(2))-methyltransferase RlmN [Patescibacteria group bacterium]
MNIEKLEAFLIQKDQPKFRLGQILRAVYQEGMAEFAEITSLPKNLRDELNEKLPILSFVAEKILEAKNGQSAKALLKLADGSHIETVLISPKPEMWSVCVSTQVGCPMGCRFCATGKLGLKRNLTAEEIVDQVLFWKQWLKKKFRNSELEIRNHDVSNIVYMGMGEPFLNWDNVSESLKILIDKNLFGFGSRAISVSTSGVTEGIEKMAREFPQVNLAISLHFADDAKRSEFMPVNKKDNLESLRQALKKYFQITNRQVFLEYIMLAGINDSAEDARKLAGYIRSIEKLQLLHVNLIRYNVTSDELQPSSREKTEHFKNMLSEMGISATIRKSLGEEIQGACGQLAGK